MERLRRAELIIQHGLFSIRRSEGD